MTITLDNGSEFVRRNEVSRALGADIYFCDPYSPYQQCTNENTNGLIQQYFPKKTGFNQVTDEALKQVVRKLNIRPREQLEIRTPEEVFLGEYSGELNRRMLYLMFESKALCIRIILM